MLAILTAIPQNNTYAHMLHYVQVLTFGRMGDVAPIIPGRTERKEPAMAIGLIHVVP